MPKKQKSIARLVDDCAVVLQKIVRMKAAVHSRSAYIQCVSCGTIKHWKEMHGGHFIARTWKSTKLMEENIHPQCPSCNTFRPERHIDDYAVYMRETYGARFVDDLTTKLKRQPFTMKRPELEDKLAELKNQCKALEQQCEELEH